MREISFDTETTGLNPRGGDRLVEIGGVELEVFAQRCGSGIARRDIKLTQQWRLGNRQGQGVFASAGTDEKNIHHSTLWASPCFRPPSRI